MRRQAWTSDRLKLLKRLWADGETAEAIGLHLGGLTRSAVLGKVFRLRLKAHPKPADERHDDQEAAASAMYRVDAPKRRRRRPARAARRRQETPSANRPRQAATTTAKRRGKSLLELTNHCCRWPQGRPGTKAFFFCGAEGADLERGMPYCPPHAQRAYVGGEGNNNPPSVTWSTLRAVFSPSFEPTRQRVAAGGSRS